ncbi:ABC transporter substrate-binding protein [Streptomyces liangshanensis]|uniref:Iron-siderophore ABC transporter substrate-binding protein n=1 Tax=Streptomyces liangshanensis TaxID=2717324 RepID=A0A6G9H3I7_9ACTN|nr:iron-siderophore ABC transporter substrate-binding protein [Streptomyces liangshanensis]QIQ05034.1 iron-siderophore ABC transporter substrate-binding protein [Streptomyces liangshanensis]
MSVRRRGAAAVVALAAALTLAACGSGSSDTSSAKSSGASSGAKADAAGKAAVATGGEDFASAAKKTAAFGTDAKPGQFPRTITHAMGKTVIEARPQRVVVLDVGELDNVVSLGIKPVGWAATLPGDKLPPYLAKQAGDPKSVGTISSLNLEAIAALKPDLILGSQLRAADKYNELSKIAPTVFSIRPGFTWKENYLLNAKAVDKLAEAQAKLADYRKRVAALDTALGSDRPTISMVRFRPGQLRLYAESSFIGQILKDVGLPRPKNQQIQDLAVEISPEKIDEADADWIFWATYGDPSKTDEAAATSSPLWKNLTAVKNGHVKAVNDETWYLGLGVTAADLVLNDLHTYLAK